MKSFEEYFIMEEKLTTKDRDKLSDDDYGVIIKDKDGNVTERAYPLNDARHVEAAARMYPFAKRKYDTETVAELRRKIIAKAKEHNVPDSKIQSVIDDNPGGKSKSVKESVGPEDDDTSGTSEFDESFDNEPDDCYTESDVFITEADKRLLNELQKKNNEIPLYELNKYGKKLMHYFNHNGSRTLVIQTKGPLIKPPTSEMERRCHTYYEDLIKRIEAFVKSFKFGQLEPIKWYKYDKLLKTLFRSLGVNYNKDRILGRATDYSLYFDEREFKKYTFNPNTDVLVHTSRTKNLSMLKPTHCSYDGVTYPKPRIYFFLEKRDKLESRESHAEEYGDNVYVLNTNKSFEVIHDMEYGKDYGDDEKDKYGKPVFINTSKPMKVIPLEQFMKTEHTTESYDVSNDCYTESAKSEKMMKVSPPDSKYVYFGSPENHMPEIKLDGPLFVTPYKSIASIFTCRDMELRNKIPQGHYNKEYEEWLHFNEKESGRCLTDVHVYVEGYPDLEPYEIKQTGYVHQILTHNWNDNYYRYPWMDASKEWLIANGNGNVEFDDVTKCEITYHISGKPGYDKLGPRQDALESFVKLAIKLIHDKYKKDQIDPIGNQNCLLCTWCFEARMRGLDVLPRPVYSPRDDVLDIPGNQIVFGSHQIKLKNYTDLASEITKAGDGCRFYCHVNWKDSKGGHEFILMRIGGKNFIIDPQQGKIEPLTKSHNYVSDINYDNSYIVQLSDKKFNRMLFDKWNDESTVLRWDPDKDIPYMLKEGMITKEEAEKELRKSSTERFTSELKRELKNNPVQESFNIDGQNIDDLNNGKIDEFISIYENKTFINLINKFNSKRHYSDAFKRVAERFYSAADNDKYEATRNGYVEYFLKPEQLHFVTKRDKPIGIVFAGAGYYDYEVFILSLNDGSVYYTKIADEYRVSKTFVEFIKSFNDGYFDKCLNKHVQEGFFNRNKSEPPEPCELYKQFEDAYNDETFTSIIKTFKNHKSLLLAEWLHKTLGDDDYVTDDMVDGNVVSFLSKQQLNDMDMTDRNYNTIGYGFASVNNPDEWLSISMTDGKVYYCGDARALEYSENVVADSFNEFLASFGDVFKSYLKGKPIQEGVIQNIKNKVSPFEKNLVYHISPEGHLDGQVFKPRVPEYLDKYDPSKPKFEDVETPRVCFSPSIDGCINAIIVGIGRWKTAEKLRDWYVYIPEKPLKEYKYRTNKQIIDEKKVYDANVTDEIWIEEPVRLKQYGVIRIDSVSNKSIKETVPTTTGKKGKRYKYNFKWHWLVKPKILKDVPYDYSPIEVCKDMIADLESYKYGIPENGRIVDGSDNDYDTKWKLQSPEEFEHNKGGICYDYVEFEEGYLDAYGIKCKKYFISTDLPDNDTHTFILVEDGKGGFIYPESSFKVNEGVHEVKNLDHACAKVADGFWKINDNLKRLNQRNNQT